MSPFINWLQNIHECHQMGKKTKLIFCSAIYSILCTCWCWWKHCQLFSCTVYLFGWFYAFICLLLVALFCIEAFFVNLFVAQFFVAVPVLYENVFFVYQFLFWRFWLCAWSFLWLISVLLSLVELSVDFILHLWVIVLDWRFCMNLLGAVFCGWMQVKHSLCKAARTLNSHEETYNYLND